MDFLRWKPFYSNHLGKQQSNSNLKQEGTISKWSQLNSSLWQIECYPQWNDCLHYFDFMCHGILSQFRRWEFAKEHKARIRAARSSRASHGKILNTAVSQESQICSCQIHVGILPVYKEDNPRLNFLKHEQQPTRYHNTIPIMQLG